MNHYKKDRKSSRQKLSPVKFTLMQNGLILCDGSYKELLGCKKDKYYIWMLYFDVKCVDYACIFGGSFCLKWEKNLISIYIKYFMMNYYIYFYV